MFEYEKETGTFIGLVRLAWYACIGTYVNACKVTCMGVHGCIGVERL